MGGTFSQNETTNQSKLILLCFPTPRSRDDASRKLRGALWDEQHFGAPKEDQPRTTNRGSDVASTIAFKAPAKPTAFYPDIDLSIPETVYSEDGSVDLVSSPV